MDSNNRKMKVIMPEWVKDGQDSNFNEETSVTRRAVKYLINK